MEGRMNFEEQVVLITGGSKGIGKAIAWAFARKGASVIINYGHDEDAGPANESQIQQSGGKAQTPKSRRHPQRRRESACLKKFSTSTSGWTCW